VRGKLFRLFTVFLSSIEARQHGIDFARQSNEHCLALQPRAIDTHLNKTYLVFFAGVWREEVDVSFEPI
jgi:hypothetical protein